jgi:hypothetical protein
MQLAGGPARDAAGRRAALGDVARDASATVADVRRLVNGPPAGARRSRLAFAIREQADARGRRRAPLASGDRGATRGCRRCRGRRVPHRAGGPVNVARHADATRCVRLSRNGALELVVEDDGGGLAAAARAGVGLVSMRERAAELGGSLQVAPRPARGTVVRALLPVNDRPEES